jgi:DNA-binding response OmpR family regulator
MQEHTASKSGAGSRASLLVVDDEKWIIDIIRINFEMRGFEVYGCFDSTEALEMARSKQPDIIILDLLMPEKNGWEVLAELQADDATRSIPVIICSVMKQSQVKERALESGAIDYLPKPFDADNLISVVEAALGLD